MDVSKLSSPEKLGALGAAATIIGGAVAAGSYPGHWGLAWIGVIAALALLAILFLPQLSPTTSLPGSRGSLLVVVGGIGAVVMVLLFLTTIAFTFTGFDAASLLFLVAVAGAAVMLWAGWQALQAEGGTFKIGAPAAPGAGAASVPPSQPAAAAPPPPAASEPPRDETPPPPGA
jgi:hypothetical protein